MAWPKHRVVVDGTTMQLQLQFQFHFHFDFHVISISNSFQFSSIAMAGELGSIIVFYLNSRPGVALCGVVLCWLLANG